MQVNSAVRAYLYERKQADEELTARELAAEVGQKYQISVSEGHINLQLLLANLHHWARDHYFAPLWQHLELETATALIYRKSGWVQFGCYLLMINRSVKISVVHCGCNHKWLLGVHGTAIFYWNRERLPDLKPPFLGWHTGTTTPDWRTPTTYTLRPDADRFVPGNPSFISLYVLDNALDYILKIGRPSIERYVLNLGTQLWEGVQQSGWKLMTPKAPQQRAGNICFMAADIEAITTGLAQAGILIWGGYAGVGRIRVSTHLYNSEEDIAQFLTALRDLPLSWQRQ